MLKQGGEKKVLLKGKTPPKSSQLQLHFSNVLLCCLQSEQSVHTHFSWWGKSLWLFSIFIKFLQFFWVPDIDRSLQVKSDRISIISSVGFLCNMIFPIIRFPECFPRNMAILRLTAAKSIDYTRIRNYIIHEQGSINYHKQANILNKSLAIIPLPRQTYKFVYNYPGRAAVKQP